MRLIILSFLLLIPLLHAAPATPPDFDSVSGESAPPAGATVVTSDELNMDQATHMAVFTGNVIALGTNFKMTCEEMTVYFTTANKIQSILAKGTVVILQPGRITHCGQAVYTHDDDKFDLTDQPDILDNQHHVEAPEIFIYRTDKKLVTKGRTKTTILQGIGSTTNSIETPSAPK